MGIKGKRLLVIGGAGLIGSHAVDALLREDVRDVISLQTSADLLSAVQKIIVSSIAEALQQQCRP